MIVCAITYNNIGSEILKLLISLPKRHYFIYIYDDPQPNDSNGAYNAIKKHEQESFHRNL
jgi:hypothetical protein